MARGGSTVPVVLKSDIVAPLPLPQGNFDVCQVTRALHLALASSQSEVQILSKALLEEQAARRALETETKGMAKRIEKNMYDMNSLQKEMMLFRDDVSKRIASMPHQQSMIGISPAFVELQATVAALASDLPERLNNLNDKLGEEARQRHHWDARLERELMSEIAASEERMNRMLTEVDRKPASWILGNPRNDSSPPRPRFESSTRPVDSRPQFPTLDPTRRSPTPPQGPPSPSPKPVSPLAPAQERRGREMAPAPAPAPMMGTGQSSPQPQRPGVHQTITNRSGAWVANSPEKLRFLKRHWESDGPDDPATGAFDPENDAYWALWVREVMEEYEYEKALGNSPDFIVKAQEPGPHPRSVEEQQWAAGVRESRRQLLEQRLLNGGAPKVGAGPGGRLIVTYEDGAHKMVVAFVS